MPRPVSETATTIDSALRVAVTTTRPPAGVNFTALESRLAKTCCRRPASPLRIPIPSSSRISSATALAAATARMLSTAASSAGPSATSSSRRVIFPEMMRDTSSRSSMMRACSRVLRSTTSMAWAVASAVEAARWPASTSSPASPSAACAARGRARPGTRPWRGWRPRPPAGPAAPGAGARRACRRRAALGDVTQHAHDAGRQAVALPDGLGRELPRLVAGLQLHGLGCLGQPDAALASRRRSGSPPGRLAHRGRPGPGPGR